MAEDYPDVIVQFFQDLESINCKEKKMLSGGKAHVRNAREA